MLYLMKIAAILFGVIVVIILAAVAVIVAISFAKGIKETLLKDKKEGTDDEKQQ